MKIFDRQFVYYFHFTGWTDISLGISISFLLPNIEFHVPFGFFRIGWDGVKLYEEEEYDEEKGGRSTFGKDYIIDEDLFADWE